MQSFGVYVPEQDAAWETQDNGTLYDDLLERYNRCDAVECLCPDGREADEDYTIWEIVSIIWVIFNWHLHGLKKYIILRYCQKILI